MGTPFSDSHHRRLNPLFREWEQKKRIEVSNDQWLAVVSYWAVWPFETWLLLRCAVLSLPDLNPAERDALADILKKLLTMYNNLFETSFPYSMDWHGAPFVVDSPGESFERQTGRSQYSPMEAYAHWQIQAHFYPTLLHSATVKKILVGYEMLAGVQRYLTAEQAEQSLRILSEIQYSSLINEEKPA